LRLALAWGTGGTVRVDAGSRLECRTDRVLLRAGAVYVESAADGAAPLVETPLGVVRHLGTRYEVRVAPRTVAVTVRDGRVEFARLRRTELVAAAGERLAVDVGGGVIREPVAADDARWSWTESVAPPFAIEGRTLHEFVAWYARESGRELRYASPAIRAAAGVLVLRGSVDDLAPAEALAAVLSTTRFRAQIEDGALVVAAREDTRGMLR
jgi:ferric-dicitrate binding protein FerR (iron transport regulator)